MFYKLEDLLLSRRPAMTQALIAMVKVWATLVVSNNGHLSQELCLSLWCVHEL